MIYIGVDPGATGGFAVIMVDGADGERVDTAVGAMEDGCFFRTMRAVADDRLIDKFAIVEQVGSMPKQGVASTFKLGKQAGLIEGALSALKIPYQLVVPRKWKAEFGLNSDKAKSCEVCKRLFPNVDLKRTKKCRKDHDGMAEALLMAEYARRISGRNE